MVVFVIGPLCCPSVRLSSWNWYHILRYIVTWRTENEAANAIKRYIFKVLVSFIGLQDQGKLLGNRDERNIMSLDSSISYNCVNI